MLTIKIVHLISILCLFIFFTSFLSCSDYLLGRMKIITMNNKLPILFQEFIHWSNVKTLQTALLQQI